MTHLVGENTFYILGVIHRDRDSRALIHGWLNKIKPHFVTLEFSQYGLMFRKEKGPMYRKELESVLAKMRRSKEAFNEEASSFLYSYIDLPGEYEAASRYCSENGASFHLVDMDLYSSLKLKKADELFSEENIKNIIRTFDGHVSGNERVMARLFFDSGVQTAPYTEEMLARDRYMAKRIRILMQRHPGKKFTHITGWQHLKDPHDVFAPFHPVKVFPYD